MKNHYKLLLGLVVGIALGSLAHPYQDLVWVQKVNEFLMVPVGQIFLRLLFMIVVPMVFSALVLGVYDLARHQGVGKVASKTLMYTIIASTASVMIGIGLVNFFRPGDGFKIDTSVFETAKTNVDTISANAKASKSFAQALVEIIPKNPLEAAVRALEGEMLSLMFCALFFGFAFYMYSKSEQGRELKIIPIFEEVFNASLKIVEVAMKIAPYAVFAIVFNTAFKFGLSIFESLFYFSAVVVGGLLIQQFVVYALLLKFIAKRSPWKFFADSKEVMLYAFSTSSSNACLPKSIEVAETKLGLTPSISRFVLTVGATANQNGTALFEGVTVLFLAQVFGVDLTTAQQVQVVVMCIIAGIGTAGVPGGSLPLIMIIMNGVGIPAEGIALILGVDRFLDMCRTTLNVSGDLVIAALVDDKKAYAETPQHTA
ncbi:MAG TPA: dicarboxylate/amino acid:cation symporter [Bacteriovoracaceae bacterium]|nr:dicarboxylate/amino acid:cation symporter [Bacteriovoracaceae bacterium]